MLTVKMNELLCKKARPASALFLCFLFYAVCGWIYEVALGFRYGRGFINRGFLFGPWLPVYGFGAMLMLPLQKLKKYGPLAVFAVSTMYATLIELIASYAMEIVNGVWLWNYLEEPLNFQGRIAAWPSCRFGLLILAMLYLVHPLLMRLIRRTPWRAERVIAGMLAVLFFADGIARLFLGSNLKDPSLF